MFSASLVPISVSGELDHHKEGGLVRAGLLAFIRLQERLSTKLLRGYVSKLP